jgi:hypothetical protein
MPISFLPSGGLQIPRSSACRDFTESVQSTAGYLTSNYWVDEYHKDKNSMWRPFLLDQGLGSLFNTKKACVFWQFILYALCLRVCLMYICNFFHWFWGTLGFLLRVWGYFLSYYVCSLPLLLWINPGLIFCLPKAFGNDYRNFGLSWLVECCWRIVGRGQCCH